MGSVIKRSGVKGGDGRGDGDIVLGDKALDGAGGEEEAGVIPPKPNTERQTRDGRLGAVNGTEVHGQPGSYSWAPQGPRRIGLPDEL